MTVLDEIGQEKEQISQRLMRLDMERTKLSDELNELEIAERALKRFGKAVVAGKRMKGRPANTAPADGRRRARRRPRDTSLSLGDARLKAVQAHGGEGASANEVLNYLTRKYGVTVRPNHLGMALQRHRRAGRLENRDQRWYLPPSAKSKRPRRHALPQ